MSIVNSLSERLSNIIVLLTPCLADSITKDLVAIRDEIDEVETIIINRTANDD